MACCATMAGERSDATGIVAALLADPIGCAPGEITEPWFGASPGLPFNISSSLGFFVFAAGDDKAVRRGDVSEAGPVKIGPGKQYK